MTETKTPQRKCACGCGQTTRAYFAVGHDARYIARLKKVADGTLKPSDLPEAMRAGLNLKRVGSGWVALTHYDGRPMGRRRYWKAVR